MLKAIIFRYHIVAVVGKVLFYALVSLGLLWLLKKQVLRIILRFPALARVLLLIAAKLNIRIRL
jgi:hypothetical protein